MARPLRIEMADGIYHVTSRGLERRKIVREDADRERWLDLLDSVCTRRDWRVFSWALMDNHFHLHLRTPHADLSAGMHDLNSGYASYFNRQCDRRGPLYQGRFKGILVEDEGHAWELSRYVHLNPVRAKLVTDPARYRWSSCRHYFDSRGRPDWLAWEEVLREHGGTVRTARRRYREYLAAGVASPPASPLKDAVAGTVLGSPGFVATVREWLEDRLVREEEIPSARELAGRCSVAEVERAVAGAYGVAVPDLRRRRRGAGNEARLAAIYLSRRLTGLGVRELGGHFGGVGGAAISNAVRQVEQTASTPRSLRRKLDDLQAGLRLKYNM